MKNFLQILIITISFFLISCSQMASSSMYLYVGQQTDTEVEQEPPEDVEVSMPDAENDPFEDYKDPDVHFPATMFDTWEIRAMFNSVNAPTYNYVIGNWGDPIDTIKNEYKKGGPNTSGAGQQISSVVYYLYKSKNPTIDASGSYNTGAHGERIERFYFYRFTGDTASPSLDNYLIAVDTYTKLVFAFALPTGYRTVFGQQVPTAWGSVDTEINDGKNKFYEYDPVGIVRDDGTFELYEWYMTKMGKADYEPIIGDPTREVATYGKPGRSPYVTVNAEEAGANFSDNVAGKVYSFRGSEGASDYLHTYTFSNDATTLTYSLNKWRDEKYSVITTYTFDSALSGTIATYTADNVDVKIDLLSDLTKLEINNVHSGTLNYSDPGPLFFDRVKSQTFTGSGHTYKFSPDGKKMKHTAKEDAELGDDWTSSYYNVYEKGSRNQGVYKKQDAIYWGMKLHSEKGIEDDTLRFTGSSWGGVSTTPSSGANSDPAWIVSSTIIPPGPDDPTVNEQYLETIKGKTFRYRSDELGKSDTLEIFIVSDDGKTITTYTQTWRQVDTTKVSEYVFNAATSNSEAMYSGNILAVIDNGVLTLGGKTGYEKFEDLGPWFRDRVKGQEFEGSGHTYKFDSTGSGIAVNGDIIYTYSGRETRTHAEYNENFNIDLGIVKIPMTRYWGVRINSDTSVNATLNNRIQWTISLLTANTHSLPNEARHSPAWIGGNIPSYTDEDKYLMNIGSGGNVFSYRSNLKTYTTIDNGDNNPSNDTYSEDTNGSLYLKIYETSIDGRTITEYNHKWGSVEPVATGRVFNYTRFMGTNTGIFTDNTGTEHTFVLNDDGNLCINDNANAFKNYTDPGPVFYDRVAGKSYYGYRDKLINDKYYTYYFSPDGTRMKYTSGGWRDPDDWNGGWNTDYFAVEETTGFVTWPSTNNVRQYGWYSNNYAIRVFSDNDQENNVLNFTETIVANNAYSAGVVNKLPAYTDKTRW